MNERVFRLTKEFFCWVWHYAKCFAFLISCNPLNNVGEVQLFFPLLLSEKELAQGHRTVLVKVGLSPGLPGCTVLALYLGRLPMGGWEGRPSHGRLGLARLPVIFPLSPSHPLPGMCIGSSGPHMPSHPAGCPQTPARTLQNQLD